MSSEAKNRINEFFDWLVRAACGIIIAMLVKLTGDVAELVSDKKADTERMNNMENQIRAVSGDVNAVKGEMNDLFKNYDLKPKK